MASNVANAVESIRDKGIRGKPLPRIRPRPKMTAILRLNSEGRFNTLKLADRSHNRPVAVSHPARRSCRGEFKTGVPAG